MHFLKLICYQESLKIYFYFSIHFNLRKVRAVIAKKYIVIEISKTGNNKSVKWIRCPYCVSYCLGEIVVIVLPFIIGQDTLPIGNKVSDKKFYWKIDNDFFSRLKI